MDANDLVEKSKVIEIIDKYRGYREPFPDGVYEEEWKQMCSTKEGLHQFLVGCLDLLRTELRDQIDELR
jgi:hypothetical protein